MADKEIRNKYLRVKVTEKMKDAYNAHCKKFNYVPTKRLRALVEKELRGEIK